MGPTGEYGFQDKRPQGSQGTCRRKKTVFFDLGWQGWGTHFLACGCFRTIGEKHEGGADEEADHYCLTLAVRMIVDGEGGPQGRNKSAPVKTGADSEGGYIFRRGEPLIELYCKACSINNAMRIIETSCIKKALNRHVIYKTKIYLRKRS